MKQQSTIVPFAPSDLQRLQFITGAALSPDGSRALYGVSRIDESSLKESAGLWLLDIESGCSRPFTAGAAYDAAPCWSPDGRQVAFLSTRGGAPQIYVQPVDGGEARGLTHLKLGVGGGLSWSPDGRHIAFTAAAAEDLPGGLPDPARPVRIDRLTWRFNAMGYLHLSAQNIHIVEVSSGQVTRLTDDGWMHSNPLWSPDGQEILFFANLPPDSHNIYDYRILAVNLQGAVRVIVPVTSLAIAAAWTPDGKRIVYSGTAPGQPVFSNTALWVVDRAGGPPENRTPRLIGNVTYGLQGDLPERFASQVCVAPDGLSAWCDVQTGGAVHICRVALSGPECCEPVVTGLRSAHLVGAAGGRLVYASRDFYRPSDLHACQLDGGGEQRLTRLNDALWAQRLQPQVQPLRCTSPDGQEIEGWIMLPPEGQAPYPTVLYIHGGPQAAFGSTFSIDFHLLAGAGFAVLFTNPRGSTGYGSAFTTAILGDLGGLDYADVMASVDQAVALGLADPDRLGITGASYGGYLTCMSVGKTHRFRAAVAESPVVDFTSLYGTSDLGVFLCTGALGGPPHTLPAVYRRCSPSTYAHNCVTPTLLIHNEEDLRAPAGQAELFYTLLKASGCTVEMLRLPRSHHGGTFRGPVPVRLAQNEALLEWMQRYVMGGEESKQ